MKAEAVNAGMWGIAEDVAAGERTPTSANETLRVIEGWNPEKFAREQIRSLVCRVFSSSLKPPIRQVVFCAVESETDVRSICTQVAATLAIETAGSVVLVGASVDQVAETEIPFTATRSERTQRLPLRERSIQVCRNLWIAPPNAAVQSSTSSLHAYLSEIRREFEYSVIVAHPAGDSNDATAMAQFADGMVLVLSAGRTRRAAASRVKKSLQGAQVRLLGVVLSDREFPIPDRIYRRL